MNAENNKNENKAIEKKQHPGNVHLMMSKALVMRIRQPNVQ